MTTGRAGRVLTLAVLVLSLGARARAGGLDEEHLPSGWTIVAETTVPAAQAAAIGERLGGAVTSLVEQRLQVHDLPARLNLVTCADAAAADVVEAALVRMRGPAHVVRRGREIVEIVGTDVLLSRRIAHALGAAPGEATWRLHLRLALVPTADAGEAEAVFGAFQRRALEGPSAARDEQIRSLVAAWSFGDTLRLRRRTSGGGEADWAFDPAPVETRREGDDLVARFGEPTRELGIPYVDAIATVRTRGVWTPTGDDAAVGLLEPTAAWPTDADAVEEALRPSGAVAAEPRTRLRSILALTSRGIERDGPMGGRRGVLRVLAERRGRCWDQSDVLVTLARAASLPARQVIGWLPTRGEGHVWAEVHLPGEGWLPVDATAPWLGVSEDYVPLVVSEDGDVLLVHLRLPVAERLR